MCSFGSGFRLRMFFSGSGFRGKVFLSLAQIPNPGCISFIGFGFRAGVLRDCARATDHRSAGAWPGSLKNKILLLLAYEF